MATTRASCSSSGPAPEARRFAERVERHRELGLRVIGYLAVEPGGRPRIDHRPVLGGLDDIEDVLHDRIVDEVAVCLGDEDLHRIESITRLCEEEGKIVRIPLDDVPVSLPGGRVEDFDRGKVLSLVYGPDRVVGLVVKRLLDVALAALRLDPPVARSSPSSRSPSSALDGRPVLFRQTRVGLHGRPFLVVKFRTMVPDAEDRLAELEDLNEIKGHAFKMTDDPRLSRDRGVPAQDEHRRAAPAVERAARRDEPRRAAPAAAHARSPATTCGIAAGCR